MENEIQENIAETLARELKQPIEIGAYPENQIRRIASPNNWDVQTFDDEKYLSAPRRKTAKVTISDKDSFIDYVKRHGSLTTSTIWCKASFSRGDVSFLAIINDHGEQETESAWRDHVVTYLPVFSEEWTRWAGSNKKQFTQVEFADFIENNRRDITSVEGSPSGADMLEMALSFEANQDMRFKSAIRLQNGGVQMQFVQDDDAQTLAKMQVFDRFSIGIPVFWNGEAFRCDARLRYRVRDGKLTFWYELVRHDKVLEEATQTIIENIRRETGTPFFFGNPFA